MGWLAIGNPRPDQCHAAFIVLQQKGAHQSTGISSRLISRGRGGTNLPLFVSHPLFLSHLLFGYSLLLHPLVCYYIQVSVPFPLQHPFSFFTLRPLFFRLTALLFRVLSLSLCRSSAFTPSWRHPSVARRRRGDSRQEVQLEVELIAGRSGPAAVVMKTYEIYSIWADAITPPPTTDQPTALLFPPLVRPLRSHLCTGRTGVGAWYVQEYVPVSEKRIQVGVAMVRPVSGDYTLSSPSSRIRWKFQQVQHGDCHDAGGTASRMAAFSDVRWIRMVLDADLYYAERRFLWMIIGGEESLCRNGH